jgi:hypothetical protein
VVASLLPVGYRLRLQPRKSPGFLAAGQSWRPRRKRCYVVDCRSSTELLNKSG